MTVTIQDLPRVLEDHRLWVRREGGSRADLSGANLSRADLSGANLSRADLSGANLSRADLSGADLSGAKLLNTDLSGADLAFADLSRAYLYSANLSGADLRNADLFGADFAHANLRNADLNGAGLYGANLCWAVGIISLGHPDGYTSAAYLRNGQLMLRVGCRSKTLAEARLYWADKADRQEVLAAIKYAVRMATLRGWEFES